MPDLLDIKVNRDGINLDCWLAGGEYRKLKAPVKPYFFTSTPNPSIDPMKRLYLSALHRAPMRSVVPTAVWQESCPTVYDVRRSRDLVEVVGESDVRFIERLCIDYGFQNDVTLERLRCVGIDIEAEAESGQFPNPKREFDPLTALAVHGGNVSKGFVGSEKEIIGSAIETIRTVNPDVIFTYSGTGIDYEYPLVRAHINGLSYKLGRRGDEPYIMKNVYRRKFFERTEVSTLLEGRLCMDVFNEVLFDQSLTGMRRGLKVVGRHFFPKVEIVEVDRARIHDLTSAEKAKYCLSDARLAYMLGIHYLRGICALARRYKVPLGLMVRRKPSHLGNLFYGRAFNALGIISDGSNGDRFKELLE